MCFVQLSALKDVQQEICATQFHVQLLLFLSQDKQDNFLFQFNLVQLRAQSYLLHQFHVRHQMFFVQTLTLKDAQLLTCVFQDLVQSQQLESLFHLLWCMFQLHAQNCPLHQFHVNHQMFSVQLSAPKDVQQEICATQFLVQLLLFLSPDKQDNFQFQFNLFQLHAQNYPLHQFHVRHQMFFVQILTLKDAQLLTCVSQDLVQSQPLESLCHLLWCLLQLPAQNCPLHQFHVKHQMFYAQLSALKDVQQGICAMQFHVHLLLFLSPDKLEFGIQNFYH